jgi:large subunit ribosomal protein L5
MHTSVKEKYSEARKTLGQELKIKNDLAIPGLKKIVVNMGTGESLRNKEQAAKLHEDMASITGQKPAIRAARVSIAGFNLRAGQPVGLTVTLRGERMYQFLDKLISVVLPRLRDFRGISRTSFDQNGNYTLGFSEHTVFPEIDLAKADRTRGLEITIVSNSGSKERGLRLLELLGMPFIKEDQE